MSGLTTTFAKQYMATQHWQPTLSVSGLLSPPLLCTFEPRVERWEASRQMNHKFYIQHVRVYEYRITNMK